MISHLKGKLFSKSPNEIVIECNGVGYLAQVSLKTSEEFSEIGKEVLLHTFFIPKEDSHNLYGFSSIDEREVFKLIISVSGIGPKTALTILSSISIDDFREKIISNNTLALSKIPGIGKKTVERLVLELSDKINKSYSKTSLKSSAGNSSSIILEEAISALVALGYNRAIAEKSVIKASKELENPSAEKLIRLALKFAIS